MGDELERTKSKEVAVVPWTKKPESDVEIIDPSGEFLKTRKRGKARN